MPTASVRWWVMLSQCIGLAGIAAREINGSCRPGCPCQKASGTKARWNTGRIIVRYPAMRCRRIGVSYQRALANCQLQDGGIPGYCLSVLAPNHL